MVQDVSAGRTLGAALHGANDAGPPSAGRDCASQAAGVSVHIEPLTRALADDLGPKFAASFMAATWRKYEPGMLRSAFRDEVLACPARAWVVARQGEERVGFCTVEQTSTHAYVAQMSVVPHMQRQGIGRQLVEFVQREFGQQGGVQLITRRVNGPALSLYAGLGFARSDFMHEGYDAAQFVGMTWRPADAKDSREAA